MPGQKGYSVCQGKKGTLYARAKRAWCAPGQKGHGMCQGKKNKFFL